MTWLVLGAALGAAVASAVGAAISFVNLRLIGELHDRMDEIEAHERGEEAGKDAETLLLERLNTMVGRTFAGRR